MPTNLIAVESVAQRILLIRGQKVMLDADLAELFGVPTKVFNQAIRRNLERFPADFMFQLTEDERESLRSQIVTSNKYESLKSQIATSNTGRGGRRYVPYVFTKHGAIMEATILNSPSAVEMSVFIVRAFVQLREMLSSNAELAEKLLELERKVSSHDQAIAGLIDAINMKLAQRFVCPLARLRDNQRLGCGRLQPSRMASCFTQRVGERETGMTSSSSGEAFAVPVRQLMMPAAGKSRPIGKKEMMGKWRQ